MEIFKILGANCEIDINECEGDPCQNGATCTDGIDEYTCLCKAGYTGENCEEEINECEVYQPCQNQARCVGELISLAKYVMTSVKL